ncbi:MAG: signal peptide protein [Chitinophagaceae bacterium]|nr:signal peptide protein [Chitinophagaceae bacterium]
MKNIVLLVVFVLGIVFMQFVQAQSVDDIINKYIDARGGKDKLKAIQSLYMEGSRQMMGNEVLVKVTTVQGKLFRTDFELGGTIGYTIVTPTEGWSFIPMQSPKVESIPADRLKNMQGQLDITGPLVDYAAKGNKAELQGKETIEGKEAYKIKMTLNTGKEVTYYIDTKTYLLIQSRQIGAARGNNPPQEVITNYSDYNLFDGIMFPQTIANPGSGVMGGSTTFDTIVINKTIDESQYKPAK